MLLGALKHELGPLRSKMGPLSLIFIFLVRDFGPPPKNSELNLCESELNSEFNFW